MHKLHTDVPTKKGICAAEKTAEPTSVGMMLILGFGVRLCVESVQIHQAHPIHPERLLSVIAACCS